MKIKILSNSIINRIAAGEVIERPASAVKELVENAIDAGANKIDIFIENGGRNLITVIDNGNGMSKEDLLLSVERHATSKLPEEDINKIDFFGFRGEALSSIASVSRMNITSKLKDSPEHAWKLQVNGGEMKELEPTSLSQGSKIEVRDLFFATPARLKFLKTEKAETHAIVEIISKIAMANPDIAFNLNADNKNILNLKAHEENSLFNRLNDLSAKGLKENFTNISITHPDGKILGYISTPTYNQGTSNEQYFFINKRPVKDKLLSIAVKIAYQDFIPQGRYPLVYLFLELDPSFVDVNVHPAKSEVRFKDNNFIRNIVISSIKHGISEIGNKASDHLTNFALDAFIPETKVNISQLSDMIYHDGFKKASFTPPIKTNNFIRPIEKNLTKQIFAPIQKIEPTLMVDEDFDAKQIEFPLGSACGQIHDTYIISQTNDGMVLIDQHAAHERIFYEKLKQEILNKQIKTQRLLIPEIIELPEHIIEQLLHIKLELENFGLFIENFGQTAIAVTELPALLKCSDIKKLILDIVDDLHEYGQQVSLENKIQHFLATFACHHSIRSGRSLSIKEMNSLLREMENNIHTGQCNHGRPTYIKLNLKDIEKLFERT